MFPTKITMNIVTLLFVSVLSLTYGQDRKIMSALNPGCTNCTKHETLVYITATGSHDRIHQIWDFTSGTPSVIFAIGTVNSSIEISWDHRRANVLEMSELPKYSFAYVIDKLIQYEDTNDTGHLTPKCKQRPYPLSRFMWTRNITKFNGNEAMLLVKGQREGVNATVEFKLDLLPYQDYAADLPHLIHTANSTLIDINLKDLDSLTRHVMNGSRWAIHAILIGQDGRNESAQAMVRRSLDDEHTPGVFEIMEIKTPESLKNGDGGFIQFRPVAYTKPERGVASSTNVYLSQLNRTFIPNDIATVSNFFSKFDSLVQNMSVSFGESGDGYYAKTNYTSWSFTIGYGSPPVEGFSLFVILIISFGLGVPVLLALSGVAFVLLRRCRSRNTPARFTDED